jgi:acetate---CoA ligase (ADP-forming)
MFGLGGVFVEVLNDVVLRSLPLDRAEAGRMLDGIRGRALLESAAHRQSTAAN